MSDCDIAHMIMPLTVPLSAWESWWGEPSPPWRWLKAWRRLEALRYQIVSEQFPLTKPSEKDLRGAPGKPGGGAKPAGISC